MRKRQTILGLVVGITLAVGYAFFSPEKLLAGADPSSAVEPAAKESRVCNEASPDKVLACDDFNKEGELGRWTNSNGVADKDVSGGHILLLNSYKNFRPGTEPTTQVVYDLWEYPGNITVEVKFDDFVPNDNSRFQIDFQASPGNALDLGRYSVGGRQFIKFEVIEESQSKLAKDVEYTKNSGVLKAQYTAQTGELRAFYKEAPEEEYKEMPGSPFVLPAFKKHTYIVVLYSHNFNNSGGPASVKLDWVKITSPADEE